MFSKKKKKKIVPATMIRQLNFDKTLYYNGIFLCESQLDKFVNIVKYCHCLLCIIQNWSCTTSYISAKDFSRMFFRIKSEACHICGEPTK